MSSLVILRILFDKIEFVVLRIRGPWEVVIKEAAVQVQTVKECGGEAGAVAVGRVHQLQRVAQPHPLVLRTLQVLAPERPRVGAPREAVRAGLVADPFDKDEPRRALRQDVVAKILGDLQAKGVEVTDHIVRKQMDDLLVEAKAQLAGDEG